ncbi:MAG TPA: sulfite exporter TauE/SafE family protein [Gammaproteobacteria bacterium]|nr:sulfite exporter TauE/SafE family protein [Gammaproteobacteria bacterium]
MDLTMLLLSGAIAGTLAGLLGIGGGIVIVPIVVLFFESQRLDNALAIKMALGTSLATIIFTAMSSIYTHHRKQAVQWGIVKIMTPGILTGSLTGAWLADIIPGTTLYMAFIIFLFLVSLQMAVSRVSAHRSLPGRFVMNGISFSFGTVSALMGVGGGSLNVPFLSYCGIPIKKAIATAAAIGLPIAISATLGYIIGGLNEEGLPSGSIGYVNLPVFGGVVVASLVFAPIGATLAHKLPDLVLRRLFAVFIFALATKMSLKFL